jgi:hypothetical protein
VTEQQLPTDLQALSNEYVDHPLAQIIPPRGESEYAALLDNTKKYGQREHIVLYEGKLLLGRDQLRACEEGGAEPRIDTYTGDEPLGLIGCAASGRHLDESQRAMAAARAEKIRHGGDRKTVQDPILVLVRSRLAPLFNVSKGSIASAAKLLADGDPELIRAVDQGRISVSAAAKATNTLASD